MKTILVTGSHGQLGSEIQKISDHFSVFQYIYTDIEELDITDKKALEDFVIKNKAHFLVNCAAYTNVDKAEEEVDLCYKINAEAVKNIGEVAAEQHLKVVHISTDYVFDGKNFKPYVEEDLPSPVSVYGKS
ncbi:MAG TPA: sugar nucleotide-binding protein, partial [Paludibacteraceae bacterium]|nr:sugar nucleotide-binding protein [Paludibacteraceae bacterium]